MSRTSWLQVAALNALAVLLMFGTGLAARPGDRFVVAVFPPWLSSAQVRARAEEAGADVVAASVPGPVAWLSLSAPEALSRLNANGAVLVLRASPPRICARAGRPDL